jgi:deoxyribose-phosphate aldolase
MFKTFSKTAIGTFTMCSSLAMGAYAHNMMSSQNQIAECSAQKATKQAWYTQTLPRHIDHTYLKPTAQWKDIQKVCDEAISNSFIAICIPASYVKGAKEYLDSKGGDVKIATVVGFPLGYSTKEAKAFEAMQAIMNGADEIDMVINIGQMKDGNHQFVQDDIAYVKHACGAKPLKVIVECCYLSEEEISSVTHLVKQAGADFIKTSTGFGTRGAAQRDIEIFKREEPSLRIKAAGGVKDAKTGLKYVIDFGVERIGTSSGVMLAEQERELQRNPDLVAQTKQDGSY